jgi:DNA-binding protein H-NS
MLIGKYFVDWNFWIENRAIAMRKFKIEEMDFDDLWHLHEELTKILAEKIGAEKRKLEKRLAELSREQFHDSTQALTRHRKTDRQKRKYPKVLPKYSNPSAPLETWSGRGKQPRWFSAAIKSGHSLEDLKIRVPKETIESQLDQASSKTD